MLAARSNFVGRTVRSRAHQLTSGSRQQYADSASSPLPSLAILDDYLSISIPHFEHLPKSDISISVFKSPLPQRTAQQRAALVEKLKPFQAISTMRERTPFPASLLRELPNLELLLCTGTQFETFDLDEAKKLGIAVVAAPGRGRSDRNNSTADKKNSPGQDIRKGGNHPTTHHTLAMILALARNIADGDAAIKSGGWQTSMAMGLPGKTIGVVGMGRLGASVARASILALGMKVVCWSANLTQEKADEVAAALKLPTEDEHGDKTFRVVSKEELFKTADVITLHYVLSERSRNLVSKKELDMMKDTALLVNSSRGPLINESDLLDAAESGRIRAIGLDTFEYEPLPADSPWRSGRWGKDGRSNVLLTPHMGYVEEGLMNNWYAETAENVERWLAKEDVLHRLV
ncbi:hypothetical protein QQS21_002790 [Conoideocrella luteorostrata]|uniref:Glycerate dehydrogenase n=1 Tax=Conoideocrella luteorostrata TaxID=1105319 RepID=A0AAJ0CX30_9HYPO|nr:hypothetical protein QQS21_002790 [Conoideocrella luteorostrata]